MDNTSLIGKKLYFGRHKWQILEWNTSECLLLCDVYGKVECFSMPWDTSYRNDWGENIEWPRCELCAFLNDDFCRTAFTETEKSCIRDEAYRVLDSEQRGVFLLSRSEHQKYGFCDNSALFGIGSENEWFRDSANTFDSECDPLESKCIRPAIWLDFGMTDALLPGWRELSQLLAFKDDGDFGCPIPTSFNLSLHRDYLCTINSLFSVLENAEKEAIKHFLEPIYEVLYAMVEKNDATSINQLFELCGELAPEGYYDYDQTLPLGHAIEHNAYDAITALISNGANPDFASFSANGTIQFAADNNATNNMIIFLIKMGAPVDFQTIYHVWVHENNPDFAKEILSATEFQTNNDDISECINYMLDDDKWFDCYEEFKRRAFKLKEYLKSIV